MGSSGILGGRRAENTHDSTPAFPNRAPSFPVHWGVHSKQCPGFFDLLCVQPQIQPPRQNDLPRRQIHSSEGLRSTWAWRSLKFAFYRLRSHPNDHSSTRPVDTLATLHPQHVTQGPVVHPRVPTASTSFRRQTRPTTGLQGAAVCPRLPGRAPA